MVVEKRKGRQFTREELEAQGWEYVTYVTFEHFIFKKGNRRIAWNFNTGIVDDEYDFTP